MERLKPFLRHTSNSTSGLYKAIVPLFGQNFRVSQQMSDFVGNISMVLSARCFKNGRGLSIRG